jgi:hypothetical protein
MDLLFDTAYNKFAVLQGYNTNISYGVHSNHYKLDRMQDLNQLVYLLDYRSTEIIPSNIIYLEIIYDIKPVLLNTYILYLTVYNYISDLFIFPKYLIYFQLDGFMPVLDIPKYLVYLMSDYMCIIKHMPQNILYLHAQLVYDFNHQTLEKLPQYVINLECHIDYKCPHYYATHIRHIRGDGISNIWKSIYSIEHYEYRKWVNYLYYTKRTA